MARKKLKDLYSTIKGLTDKGQFQYLTGLKGPQEGTVYKQIPFTEININILLENTYTLCGTTLLPPVR